MIKEMYQVGDGGPYAVIGSALKLLSQRNVSAFDGQRGLGFGYDNCNAAVAVRNSAKAKKLGYKDGPIDVLDLDFHVVYGSSRLYGGLDPEANDYFDVGGRCNPFSSSDKEQHAEQTAILLAEKLGLPFWTKDGFTHVYVDFTPCSKCEPWLEDRDEEWIVHYNIDLGHKAKHKKERQTFRRGLKQENKDLLMKSRSENKRILENIRSAARADTIAKMRRLK